MKTKTALTKEIVRGKDIREINNSDFWNKYDSIDMRAFEDIDFAPIGGELHIPEGVERIGFAAFNYAKNLKKVVLPNSVNFIESNAFKNAKELEEINIPEGIFKIRNECFLGCSNLKKVYLPSTLEAIDDLAFGSCLALEEITLPNKLKKIGSCGFFKCKSLKSIDLPENLTSIENNAFFECESLANEISIPDKVRNIGINAFEGCTSLEKVRIGDGVKIIKEEIFKNCTSLTSVELPEGLQSIGLDSFANCKLKNFVIPASVKLFDNRALRDNHYLESLSVLGTDINSGVDFVGEPLNLNENNFELHCNFQNDNAEYFENLFGNCFRSVYLYKDKSFFDATSNPFKKIDADAYKIDMIVEANEKGYKNCLPYITNKNFRENYVDLHNKFENKEIRFIPQDFIMEIFPNSQIDNFFVNNNHFKWRELVEKLNLNELKGDEKIESLKSLMKIYYAIGGFSEHMGKRDSAFDYVISNVATTGEDNPSPRAIGAELRARFQDFNLTGEYNPKFADFFKKYYKDNKDFMVFYIPDNNSSYFYADEREKDYLATAHNKFDTLCQIYPHYTVSGNDTRGVFYPEFVANNCFVRDYKNIRPDNGKLAYLCSLYGYSQEAFDKIQSIIDISKEVKKNYLISAVKCDKNDKVQYEFLEKDDPKGVFIGEMTNCCQRLGDLGESCVYNGYTSPTSGFLTFDEKILDENGEDSGKTQILGQAFIWYDPKTYTVCYDNIELPKSLIRNLKAEGKTENGVTIDDFFQSLEKSADALMIEMNRKGYKVDKVTVGQGFNDLKEYFAGKYKIIIPRHNEEFPEIQDENVYTDASTAQYIIRTYDQTTAKLARSITNNLDNAEELLNNFERQNNVVME